ncbi:MAG: flippase-like domain-containing protein [Magnetococcales bacterium]|nr:flippase-like domain-containing protein [Magnetococcales bacterium]
MRGVWQRLLPWLKFIFSAGLIVLLWHQGKLDFTALVQFADAPWTILSVVLFTLLSYALISLRWVILLRSQQIPLSFSLGQRITFLGIFCNLVLPGGGMAGDAVRLAHLVRVAPEQKLGAFSTLFVDRLVGLYAMMVIALVAVAFQPQLVLGSVTLRFMVLMMGLLVLGLPLGALLVYRLAKHLSRSSRFDIFLRSGGLGGLTSRLIEIVRLYRSARWQLFQALCISLLAHSLMLSVLLQVALAMNIGQLAPLDYLFATPWAWIANFLPLTPGGIGVGEAAFDQVCRWIESSPSGAPYGTIFLMYRMLTILGSFPGLILFFFSSEEVRGAMQQETSTRVA